MNTIYIYGLYSTEDGVVRYVGKTTNPKNRLPEHRREAKENNDRPKNIWMRDVWERGFDVKLKILEETDIYHWADSESAWISKLMTTNNLTNVQKGGPGGIGAKPKEYLSYEDAKIYQKEHLDATSQNDYYKKYDQNKEKYLKDGLPKYVSEVYQYRGAWINWGDFLQTGKVSDNDKHTNYLPYNEARKQLSIMGIKTTKDYILLTKTDDRFPQYRHCHRTYKPYWKSWKVFLGQKPKCLDKEVHLRYLRTFFPDVHTMGRYRKLWDEKRINNRMMCHPERAFPNFFKEL